MGAGNGFLSCTQLQALSFALSDTCAHARMISGWGEGRGKYLYCSMQEKNLLFLPILLFSYIAICSILILNLFCFLS